MPTMVYIEPLGRATIKKKDQLTVPVIWSFFFMLSGHTRYFGSLLLSLTRILHTIMFFGSTTKCVGIFCHELHELSQILLIRNLN
jgi:hypothetical protein